MNSETPDEVAAAMDREPDRPETNPAADPVPKCSLCGRERTLGDGAHPMDAYDYSPLQFLTGQPLGWYSGDDGEVCPEDMAETMKAQRR